MIEIIAEAAQGFEGRFRQAELLALGAVKAGADAVKFQLVIADELATPDYVYYDLFRSLELKTEEWHAIADIAHKAGKKIYFDVFGSESLGVAMKVGADGIKLSTTEFYNEGLMKETLKSAAKIFISIGGIPIEDVKALIAREHLASLKSKICFMYGFQAEPTPLNSNNLLRFHSLKNELAGFALGFMDHSLGGDSDDATILPLMALPFGISALEKHITLDYALQLEDYISAISPEQFKKLVDLVRKFEPALGTADLTLTELENQYRKKATKVVVAKKDLVLGTVLTENDVTLKRVGDQYKEKKTFRSLSEIVGRRLESSIRFNEPVSAELLDLN
jgi:sialic acid synthase SpsE